MVLWVIWHVIRVETDWPPIEVPACMVTNRTIPV